MDRMDLGSLVVMLNEIRLLLKCTVFWFEVNAGGVWFMYCVFFPVFAKIHR